MAPFDRSYASFYSSSIVTMAVSCTVFEIKRDICRKRQFYALSLTCAIIKNPFEFLSKILTQTVRIIWHTSLFSVKKQVMFSEEYCRVLIEVLRKEKATVQLNLNRNFQTNLEHSKVLINWQGHSERNVGKYNSRDLKTNNSVVWNHFPAKFGSFIQN